MVSFDKDNRLINYMGNIDELDVNEVIHNILLINQEDNKAESEKKKYERVPIKLHINSYGGSVYAMWALIDVIQCSKTPVYTYCTGYAMSAGLLIFIAGHKRFASPHATFMLHQLSGVVAGKLLDILDDATESVRINEDIINYIGQYTNVSKELIKKIWETKKDYYFNSNEALQLNVVDEIISRGDCNADSKEVR
jgi:ATP-dependent Clp protease protease subunit